MIAIGCKVRVMVNYDGEENGGEPVLVGDSGTVLPQYIEGIVTPSPIWRDGTLLVQRDNGTLFSIPPGFVSASQGVR
jgi:hypothetical protein